MYSRLGRGENGDEDCSEVRGDKEALLLRRWKGPREEEKAAENVYIKKVEQEKLEKLARKGPKSGEATSATPKGPEVEANPSGTSGSSTSGVSTDTNRNYAVLAGTIAAVSGLGWYLLSKPKKSDEVVD
uniref:Uncharacterized protein n=1 Tax=Ananas comosus var. bracteatus TaxID=296719 RepID=A0A6V7Q5W5_ANACO|nr:unnamed protein product [Ananas comosus var. bracteatus]